MFAAKFSKPTEIGVGIDKDVFEVKVNQLKIKELFKTQDG